MKISQMALAIGGLALVAGNAQAQTNTTLYGVMDVGVEVINNIGATGMSQYRVPTNTNTAPSRLGLRGTEELGGGLKAVYTMEMGFDPGNGASLQGGRLFGRQAFVGLSGGFGTVTLGRNYTMTFWAGLDADIHGGGIYGTGSLDSYLPNARADNSVAWRGTFSGVTLGLQYSLGRDTANAGPSPAGTNCAGESASDKQACRQWSAMIKYDTPTWGVALANDRMNGRTVGAAPDAVFGGLTSSSHSDNRLTANGWVKLGQTKVGGGVIRRTNDGLPARSKSDLLHVGFSTPVSPALTLSAQYVGLMYRGVDGYDAQLVSVRGTYNLSKRTAVFAQIGHIRNDNLATVAVSGGAPGGNPTAGKSQSALNVGIRHAF